ncbi:polyprenyl synthetase family protein [candidate division KSB1 bacterium]|nr:polyprenyl synthetase family protein [candidate division KSB1 bacterium]
MEQIVDMMSIAAPVEENLVEFESAFKDNLHADIPLAEQVVHYISGLKGKRIRPILLFLSAKLHGQINDKTLGCGLVIELLHTATLVHDDVVDASDMRRGEPTVNSLWNNKISVLVGDFLFSKTLTTMLDIRDHEVLAVFSRAAKEITEGELLQIERARDFEMTESVYFDLIYKKTASLFSAACELGAFSVNDDPYSRQKMRDYGNHLGMAFQIQDDLLDYVGNRYAMGKPTGSDIRESKITLPLIYAFNLAKESLSQEIRDILSGGVEDDDQLDRVVEFAVSHGGVEYAKKVAANYADKALSILQSYPEGDAKQALDDLVKFTVDRDK